MWYDKSLLLSHNKILNFVIGNRGGGKTYDAKLWCIKDFKKNGYEFIWVRRYKNEITQDMLNRFFDDIRHLFPEDELTVKGKKAYCNGVVMGEFISLSTSMQKKSVAYPKVNKIIYDEFLIDKSAIRYLSHEVETFLDLFETVARMRDNVRALFLANAVSIVNPYFLFFNVKPDLSKRFTIKDNVAIELFTDADFIEAKKDTRFGQLVDGTNYGSFSIDNKFLRDNDTFVQAKTPKSEFMIGIKYNSIMYGVWIDYDEGLMFVNRQHDPCSYNLYSITKEDHEPNLLLIKSLHDCKAMQRVVYAFQNGLMRFVDMQVKNQFYELISYFVR